MVSSSSEIIDSYFDLLESTLLENNLCDKPCQIFNVDESGMPLDPPSLKVVTKLGVKHSQVVATGCKTNITIVACCSAAGAIIPPMVIFDRKTLNPKLTEGEVPGTFYGLSNNGWIDTDLFDLWFTEHFLAYAPPIRPLLLLLDGHSSHYQPHFVYKAAEEQVIVFCLPPHTTHLTQPLDKGCFGPLKMCWRQKCQQYLSSNPGKVITRYQFSQLFSAAWSEAMSMANILSGFRVSGIYPFNRNAVGPMETPSPKPSLAQKTGLKFIPLFSASRRESLAVTPHFTESEHSRFQIRFEEGYDLGDDRYEMWKQMYHPAIDDSLISSLPFSPSSAPISPESFNLSDSLADSPTNTLMLQHTSGISKFLSLPAHNIKLPTFNPKTSARVLTSVENIQNLQQKEKEKREKEELKKRKEEREAKKMLKASQKSRTTTNRSGAGSSRGKSTRTLSEKESTVENPVSQRSGAAASGSSRGRSTRTLSEKESTVSQRSGAAASGSSRGRSTRTLSEKESTVENPVSQRSGAAASGSSRGRSTRTLSERVENPGKLCIDRTCSHPRAVSWVECNQCKNWYHCLCAGVKIKNIKAVRFVCYLCTSN